MLFGSLSRRKLLQEMERRCFGSVLIRETVLGAVQLLWVNMIMDSFASLALATEVPTAALFITHMEYSSPCSSHSAHTFLL